MKPNITTTIQQKKLLQKSHCKHVIKHRKKLQCTNVSNVMRVFFCFAFSMHKTVRPADTDKVANLAQDPKSLGPLR